MARAVLAVTFAAFFSPAPSYADQGAERALGASPDAIGKKLATSFYRQHSPLSVVFPGMVVQFDEADMPIGATYQGRTYTFAYQKHKTDPLLDGVPYAYSVDNGGLTPFAPGLETAMRMLEKDKPVEKSCTTTGATTANKSCVVIIDPITGMPVDVVESGSGGGYFVEIPYSRYQAGDISGQDPDLPQIPAPDQTVIALQHRFACSQAQTALATYCGQVSGLVGITCGGLTLTFGMGAVGGLICTAVGADRYLSCGNQTVPGC